VIPEGAADLTEDSGPAAPAGRYEEIVAVMLSRIEHMSEAFDAETERFSERAKPEAQALRETPPPPPLEGAQRSPGVLARILRVLPG